MIGQWSVLGHDSRGRRVCGRVRMILLDQALRSLIELLSLHPSVLEPDFDLSLREVQLAGDLPALLTSDVRVVHELVLQNHRLVPRVGFPLFSLARLV